MIPINNDDSTGAPPAAKPAPTYTAEQIAAILEQRNALARCCIFAVNHFKIPGGGEVLRQDGKGGFSMESWLTWFRRELKACGVEWDDDLLEYSRAAKTERKRMLKESPALQAKIDASKNKAAKSKTATP